MRNDGDIGSPDIPQMNREFIRLGVASFGVLFVYFVVFPDEPEVSVKLWAILSSTAGSLFAVLYLPYRDPRGSGDFVCSMTSPKEFPWFVGAAGLSAAVPIYAESILPLLTWLIAYLSVGIFYRSWPQIIRRIRLWLVDLEFLR